MTLSIGGAVKAVILANPDMSVLNSQVFRDHAPETAIEPFVVFVDPLSDIASLKGDGKVMYQASQVQVDLWQLMADEDVDLKNSLVDCLDGSKPAAGVLVMRARVTDVHRMAVPMYEVVHHTITLSITHAPD